MLLLHGEEKVEMYAPIEVDTTVICQESIVDVQDKKKAFVLVIATEIKDKESGELKAKIYTNLFVRSKGGFGHKGSYKNVIPNAPKTAPAAVRVETTTPNQAFIYRLCGDRNPLHVDP
jgi:acyl dehydratase